MHRTVTKFELFTLIHLSQKPSAIRITISTKNKIQKQLNRSLK